MKTTLVLDYPVGHPPRFPLQQRPNPNIQAILARHDHAYAARLQGFLKYADSLARVPQDSSDETSPNWVNGFIPGLDGVSLYGMIADLKPARFLEIGSGNSTRFVRRAIQDQQLATHITSIDPQPRASCDLLCDTILRSPLETLDLSVFDTLQSGDVVFMDGSHRCFMGSDVTVFFTEILPNLADGVWVGVHDICLPYDYPEQIVEWYWSEQYLLACYLLAETSWLEIVLPSVYVAVHPELNQILNPLWSRLPSEVERHGSIFWMRIKR